MPDVSASFCITKDLEVTFFTLNFSPNKLKIHGGRNSMESRGWGVITTWDAFEESWSVPSLAKAALSADLSPVFFLLPRMNVSSFSILTVWQKKLLISIFHTNIHVCVYIYFLHNINFISPNGASVDGYVFSRYVKPREIPLHCLEVRLHGPEATAQEPFLELNSSPLFFF